MLTQSDDQDPFRIYQAITHLSDLAGRMRSSSFGFKEADVCNIDTIIEAVLDLENQRAALHDQLEAETIKCSILRHEHKFLPDQYRKEIHDAVLNARQANNELLEQLRNKIVNIDASIEDLTKELEKLEGENANAIPERDRLRVQHEDVISVLNQRMSEKAGRQIQLNETRDRLRNTNNKIMDLEDDLLQLKEEMIKVRADARAEKARLKANISQTKDKTTAQTKENNELKSQLEQVTKRLEFTEKELDELRKEINQLEINTAVAEGQERAINNQINKQLKDNDELRKQILDIQRNKIEIQQKYEAENENMRRIVAELQAQIKVKEERNQKLRARCEELTRDAETVSERRNLSQSQVAEIKAILNEAKQGLVRKQEEIARLRDETARMENDMVDLGETHIVVVENFNRQIEEYREQVGKERKERMEVQAKRDVVQRTLEDFKASNNRFMAEINKKVSHGKQRHEDLTHEGSSLQKKLKQMDEKIKEARVTVREGRMSYDIKKAEIETAISNIKIDIQGSEKQLEEAKLIMATKLPLYQAQAEQFQIAQAEFETLKKRVSGMKSQKASLEDQVARTKLLIEKTVKPQADMRKSLKTYRETYLANMKSQLSEAEDLERQMYVIGTKLQTISDENQRFHEGNEKFENDVKKLSEEKEICMDDIGKLRAEYAFLKSLLLNAWNEDSELDKKFTDRDLEILSKMEEVLKNSSSRANAVTHVEQNLHVELAYLSEFLEEVAGKRPSEATEISHAVVEDVEYTDTGVNTVIQESSDAAVQPSKHFFDRQKRIDDLNIIIPTERKSSVFSDIIRPLNSKANGGNMPATTVPPSETAAVIKKIVTSHVRKGAKKKKTFDNKVTLPPIRLETIKSGFSTKLVRSSDSIFDGLADD